MDASIRSRSALITIAIHTALFLILFFTLLKTTIPPFPDGGGGVKYISIGTLADASGDVQPTSEEVKSQPTPVVKPTPVPEKDILTQETEESVARETKEVKKPKENVKPVVAKPVERKPNEQMMYHGSNAPSTSQGNSKGTGDQGQKNGGPVGYTGSPGGGTAGAGGGDGNKYGPGHGQGAPGNGPSFSLAGRNLLWAPEVKDESQETGKVVVEITVNKNGDVISANPGVRGTTSTYPPHFKMAKDAAMKCRFSNMENGAEIQKGTITYIFTNQ